MVTIVIIMEQIPTRGGRGIEQRKEEGAVVDMGWVGWILNFRLGGTSMITQSAEKCPSDPFTASLIACLPPF